MFPTRTVGVFYYFFHGKKSCRTTRSDGDWQYEDITDLIRLLNKCAWQLIYVSSGACMSCETEAFTTLAITAALSFTIVKPRKNVCNVVSYLSSNSSLILLHIAAALGWSGSSTRKTS